MNTHEEYINRCLQIAQNGLGAVSPNPLVGAVLVYDNTIIGEGYHEKYGEAHAEVNCINSVKDKSLIPFSTLYVSLEPCSHFGKTPPCANFIIEHKINKVVIATQDFSSKVNGTGIQLLKENGIEVIEHILEKKAIELNKRFFHSQQTKKPYVILKWAQSADGFLSKQGKQIQLSNDIVNTLVHQWRHEEDAIWVGYNTVKVDNPQLNVRHIEGKNPVRIIVDADLSLDKHFHIFDNSQKTIVYNLKQSAEESNTTFIQLYDGFNLDSILSDLYSRNITSVIVEGGSKLLNQFIEQKCWNEARIISTNKILEQGVLAPTLQHKLLDEEFAVADNFIQIFKSHNIF